MERIADYMGRLKGKGAIGLFSVFLDLRRRSYWGEPLLGGGLMCGDGRVGTKEDTQVCKISRTAGTKTGRISFWPVDWQPGTALGC